jgi:hypothetical protein
MSWWDRFKCWWLAISEAKVVGRSAPVDRARWLSVEDREWLHGLATVLESATRTEAGMVVFTLSDELARSMAGRLRELAG